MKKKFFDEFELVKMSRNSVVVVKSGTPTNNTENWVYVSRNAFNKICEDQVVDWTVVKKQISDFGPVMNWLNVLAWQQ